MTVGALLGYSPRMRSVSKFILALAGVSFLTITLSGFHLHADAVTHDEKAPHEHVHHYAAPPELDEGHIDISVFEPATGFSKGETVALVPVLPEIVQIPRTVCPPSSDAQNPLLQRHVRWRPELRGPPSPV